MSTFLPDVEPSALSMARLLTLPFRRGAESLEIPFAADAAGATPIAPYSFNEYLHRYGAPPDAPRYILVLRERSAGDAMQVDVDYTVAAVPKSISLSIPSSSLAGSSFLIPIPENETPNAILTRFRVVPVAQPGNRFAIVALLGNLAKLAWVLGCEKDEIRQYLLEIRSQRTTASARSYSLDRLGDDLRVPRFPPREHAFDPDTIALYHFNDVVPNGGAVKEESVRFGLPGHDGVNDGAQSVPAGKFGAAFRIDTSGIKVASHADFNVAAGASITVEAFVRADIAVDAAEHMMVSRGAVNGAGDLTAAGWSLSLADHRGFGHNIRWSVNDGNGHAFEIFADLDVADGAFHHVAGIIDGPQKRLRLLVDGRQRASTTIEALGAIANGEPLWIGRSGAGHLFSGVVDEARISRMARTNFHPVLGEGDDAYRQRLGIFERWLLPAIDSLTEAINSRVRIDNDPSSFVLVEKSRSRAAAGAIVRILPAHLTAGQHIDAEGNLLSSEDAAASKADPDFAEVYLVRHDRPAVDYAGDEQRHRMQAATAAALDQLLGLIAALNPPVAGNLLIVRSYDPASSGLHAVGRALRLRHAAIDPDRLAVLAHRAGFDYVLNDDPNVYASVAPADKLAIAIEARPPADTPPAPIDVFDGLPIDVHVEPVNLPRAGTFEWSLIPLGPAAAHLVPHPADPAMSTAVDARPRVRIVADAPGEMVLRVDYRLERRVVTGTRRIRISTTSVAGSIGRDGDLQASEASTSGALHAPLDPIYLVTSNAAGVNYGGDPNNKKMHIALERAFRTLLARNAGLAAGLSVAKAYDPVDLGLHAAGRAILMSHGVLASDKLAALAHQAGFDFVERRGGSAYASVADESAIEIVRQAGLTPLEPEIVAGTPIDLRVRFDPLPGGGSYNWSIDPVGFGTGSFNFVLRPQVRFTPAQPGLASLQVFFHKQDADAMLPYTFEVRLNPALEAANAVVPKPAYDVVMNILNYFHPIGVEVLTGRLRAHVVEVEHDPAKAFPAYTYPHFRA